MKTTKEKELEYDLHFTKVAGWLFVSIAGVIISILLGSLSKYVMPQEEYIWIPITVTSFGGCIGLYMFSKLMALLLIQFAKYCVIVTGTYDIEKMVDGRRNLLPSKGKRPKPSVSPPGVVRPHPEDYVVLPGSGYQPIVRESDGPEENPPQNPSGIPRTEKKIQCPPFKANITESNGVNWVYFPGVPIESRSSDMDLLSQHQLVIEKFGEPVMATLMPKKHKGTQVVRLHIAEFGKLCLQISWNTSGIVRAEFVCEGVVLSEADYIHEFAQVKSWYTFKFFKEGCLRPKLEWKWSGKPVVIDEHVPEKFISLKYARKGMKKSFDRKRDILIVDMWDSIEEEEQDA